MNKMFQFLGSIWDLSKVEIPAQVIERTKLALLDYLGVTLAGYKAHQDKINNLINSFGKKDGEIYPVGISTPININNAVFLNGLNSHVLDFDDGTNAGIIHLGSPIFSVLLALAQKYSIEGRKLLEAAVIGYETSFTMARSIQPTHKLRGYHATGTCGLLGIAVSSAHALDFSQVQLKNAFSTASVSATGTLKVLDDKSELKPYNVAKTSLLGLIAVQMARAGFETPDDSFSGISGFLSQMYGTDQVEFVPTLLDGSYAVEKAYIKPYAACRYTHPSIDIAKELRLKGVLKPEQIEKVVIRTYSPAVKNHDHTDIKGVASGRMSIPYNIAVSYLSGETGLNAFTPIYLENRDILELASKVIVLEDDNMTSAFPQKTYATVEMYCSDGSILRGKSELPKGEPENPMSRSEVIEKFVSLAEYSGKTTEEANKIVATVFDIEKDIVTMLQLLK